MCFILFPASSQFLLLGSTDDHHPSILIIALTPGGVMVAAFEMAKLQGTNPQNMQNLFTSYDYENIHLILIELVVFIYLCTINCKMAVRIP